jgi:hypothetical protein
MDKNFQAQLYNLPQSGLDFGLALLDGGFYEFHEFVL